MKHHALEQLQIVAKVNHEYPHPAMSRRERLDRWAELLERNPHRLLSTLHGTENRLAVERAVMRSDCSPISVALDDPVLRAVGLENDSYGEAKRFFELTDNQLHNIVCHCHFGATLSAANAAHHVRAISTGGHRGLLARLRDIFVG
jgi:hypothetical protein